MLNSITLVGRFVSDPQSLKTNTGKSVSAWRLAVTISKDESLFIDCKAFEKTADLVNKSLRKGSLVAISGRLHQRTYTNKENKQVTAYEVLVSDFSFLEPKAKDPKQGDIAIEIAEE